MMTLEVVMLSMKYSDLCGLSLNTLESVKTYSERKMLDVKSAPSDPVWLLSPLWQLSTGEAVSTMLVWMIFLMHGVMMKLEWQSKTAESAS